MVKKSDVVQSSPSSREDAKYKGVRKRKWGKWVCEIRLPNSRDRIWLGSYDSPIKAARAFDAAQFCLRGRSANFNFPDNPPDITRTRSMTPAEIQAAASRFANLPVEDSGVVCRSTEADTVVVEEEEEEESMLSYSPSVSDAATVQIESDVVGVDGSFYDQLINDFDIVSDNFGSDFQFMTGFEDFGSHNLLYSTAPNEYDSFATNNEDCYDASIYQGSFLWNF